jgi:hypothetical protein
MTLGGEDGDEGIISYKTREPRAESDGKSEEAGVLSHPDGASCAPGTFILRRN